MLDISRKGETAEAERRSVAMFKTMDAQRKMRILSEEALQSVLPFHLEDGTAYQFISSGDVDAATYLRHIVRDQHVDYALVSTWCMAKSDAEEFREWLKRGDVGRMDFYVGEIFKDGYRGCIDVLCECAEIGGGRVARFRNHSKVCAVFGDRYAAVVETSANVDTNPRTEQACITVDRGLAEFYKDYFDGIKDFDGRFPAWRPWQS